MIETVEKCLDKLDELLLIELDFGLQVTGDGRIQVSKQSSISDCHFAVSKLGLRGSSDYRYFS